MRPPSQLPMPIRPVKSPSRIVGIAKFPVGDKTVYQAVAGNSDGDLESVQAVRS